MMTWRWIAAFAGALALWLPGAATADWYDNFDDGQYAQDPNDRDIFDPNLWDIDNPHWIMYEVTGWQFLEDANTGWLRLFCDSYIQFSALMAFVDYGDSDPDTSETYWDDTRSHYILARTLNVDWNEDPFGQDYPNDYNEHVDRGNAFLVVHVDPATWQTFWVEYDYPDDRPWWGGWFGIQAANGPFTNRIARKTVRGYRIPYHWPGYANPNYDPNDPNFWADPNDPNTDPNTYDPNDPNWQDPNDPNYVYADPNMLDPNNLWADPGYMDEHNGFWMCLQFQVDDPNYESGDPNGKSMKAACWNGGKFDWDGIWTISRDFTGWDPDNDPDPNTSWWPEWYRASGICAIGSGALVEAGGARSDVAYDGLEVRTGVFTNTWRTLTLTMKDCCELNLDANLPHPDGGDKRQYTNGTAIVLDTVVPCGNKSFKKWRIMGPNDAGDPAYQEVNDTNAILYLTMDGDYAVRAVCKCGGGGIEPFAGIVLLLLGLGVLIRRLT